MFIVNDNCEVLLSLRAVKCVQPAQKCCQEFYYVQPRSVSS